MKIDRVTAGATPGTRRGERAKAAKSGSFSKTLSSGETALGASVSGAAGLGPLGALLAAQEISGDQSRDDRGRQRGEDLIERLDEVRLALLDGRLSAAVIEGLAALAAARPAQVSDPRLAEILDEIELRAAVELAKLGR